MRQNARIDKNQATIVDALRQLGYSVVSLASLGRGCPDLLVGAHGHNWLFEVKTPTGTLRSAQKLWIDGWKGQVVVVHTLTEVLDCLWR